MLLISVLDGGYIIYDNIKIFWYLSHFGDGICKTRLHRRAVSPKPQLLVCIK